MRVRTWFDRLLGGRKARPREPAEQRAEVREARRPDGESAPAEVEEAAHAERDEVPLRETKYPPGVG